MEEWEEEQGQDHELEEWEEENEGILEWNEEEGSKVGEKIEEKKKVEEKKKEVDKKDEENNDGEKNEEDTNYEEKNKEEKNEEEKNEEETQKVVEYLEKKQGIEDKNLNIILDSLVEEQEQSGQEKEIVNNLTKKSKGRQVNGFEVELRELNRNFEQKFEKREKEENDNQSNQEIDKQGIRNEQNKNKEVATLHENEITKTGNSNKSTQLNTINEKGVIDNTTAPEVKETDETSVEETGTTTKRDLTGNTENIGTTENINTNAHLGKQRQNFY